MGIFNKIIFCTAEQSVQAVQTTATGLFEKIGVQTDYVVLALMAGFVILLAMFIVVLTMYNKLNRKYNKFMAGDDGKTLEKVFIKRLDEIEYLKAENENNKKDIVGIRNKMLSAYQKMSILKYDAFAEMGGKLSFSICMLDDNNNGFIITSMHSTREGCYIYVKEIIKGESFVLLSEEEKQVLSDAKEGNE